MTTRRQRFPSACTPVAREDSKILGRPNPLLAYPVLAEVMSYLSVADLKKCRLVHSAWKGAGTPLLKKNSTFGANAALKSVISTMSRRIAISRLREVRTFRMKSCCLDLAALNLNSLEQKLVLEFWKGIGGNFQHLKVSVSIGTLDQCEIILSCFPNLKSLEINISQYLEVGVGLLALCSNPIWLDSIQPVKSWINVWLNPLVLSDKTINFISNFFGFLQRVHQNKPNLETLKLQNCPGVHLPHADGSTNLQTKYQYKLSPAIPTLTSVYVECYFKDFSIWYSQMLLTVDINLRQLELSYIPTDRVETNPKILDGVFRLLGLHRATLEVLEFQIPSTTSGTIEWPLTFPTFPKLKKLTIKFVLRMNEMPFTPVKYATQFPALRELRLIYISSEDGRKGQRFDQQIQLYNQFFPDDGQVHEGLRILDVKVPHPHERDIPMALSDITKRIEQMFPNVHNHPEVNAFRAIRQKM